MANYFPRQTVVWKAQDTHPFRRISLSLPEMAILTGVVLHVARAFAMPRLGGENALLLGGVFVLGVVFLCGMATVHLGNYPVRHWTWRAPAFAAAEALTEIVVALLLILVGREPLGTTYAEMADWPSLAAYTFAWRLGLVVSFTLVLAGVVQLVRRLLVHKGQRSSTLDAARRSGAQNRPVE